MRALLQSAAGVAVSAVVVSAATSCDHGCTAMGCGSLVEIRFEPAITEAGQYIFALEADGVRSVCEVDFDRSGSLSRSDACSSLVVEGTGRGSPSTPPGWPFAIIGIDLAPAEVVAVQVSREGVLWAEHHFEPEYKGVEINGPGCGECPMAREELALP
jgi:hypothetical protein